MQSVRARQVTQHVITNQKSDPTQKKPAVPTIARRSALGTLFAAPLLLTSPAPSIAVTIDEVTPQIAQATQLNPREQAIVDVYDRCNPGVVNIFDISLTGRVAAGGPQNVEQAIGNGTGFIWDDAGHVVTNYHVLANILSGSAGKLAPSAKLANVYLLGPDGYQQAFNGLLVGTDKQRDIVVLKIDAPKSALRPLTLGNSDSLKIGQPVIAIGNPFGFEHTLTTGIVSALGRGFQSQTGSVIGGGIQHDCAINPGNSGGPLLDTSGRVIGVNTAIFTNTGTSVGIGFAAPINAVAKVVNQLIRDGKVTRASLGIQIAPDPIARALKVNEGVLVQSLDEGSTAGKAGILPTRRGLGGIVAGDVIIALAGKKVRNPFDLAAALDEESVGVVVEVEIVRGVDQSEQQRMKFNVTLQAE